MNTSSTTIFIIGDSTASNYPEERTPQRGWGQMLERFFDDRVRTENHAANGRSSKSFLDEGRFAPIRDQIRPGDYLFIQFGHNDEKDDPARHTEPGSTYEAHLTIYIDAARNAGATPVLLTSINRRQFDESGNLALTHGEYIPAVIALAEKLHVPLIDMCAKSRALFEQLGPEDTKPLFLWLKPGEYPGFPDGAEDNTHFSEHGAVEMAKLAIEGIQELELPIAFCRH